MAEKDSVTDEELKLLGAMRKLKIKPEHIETPADFESYMKHYEETVGTHSSGDRKQNPRISTFFGESGKGDVTYPTWRYEILCLIEEKIYSPDQILLAIRKSAKGDTYLDG